MTRKPKSPIARWREVPSEWRSFAFASLTGARRVYPKRDEQIKAQNRVLGIAIAVLKHAARKRKVK